MKDKRSKKIDFGTLYLVALFWTCICAVKVQARTAGVGSEMPDPPCAGFLAEMHSQDMKTWINGTRIAFATSQHKEAPFDESSKMYLQMTSIAEYERGLGGYYPFPIYDLQLSKCQCNVSRIEDTANQVHTTGWRLSLSACPPPQQFVSFTLNITTSNATTSEIYSPTMQGSALPELVYTTFADSIKLGIEFEGWQWNDTVTTHPTPNNTFLQVGLRMAWESPGNTSITLSRSLSNLTATTRFGDAILSFALESGFILDGQPVVQPVSTQEINFSQPNTNGLLQFDMGLAFLEPATPPNEALSRWNHYYYDPSLLAIPGNRPTAGSPKSAPTSSSTSSPQLDGIALGLTLSAIAALITLF